MADLPIIFSAPMVRVLLEGRKTMTRRLAFRVGHAFKPTQWMSVQPGDRLWVRENFGGPVMFADEDRILYAATDFDWRDYKGRRCKWRPSIHMPRWASRLTLVVTATKIERLQDISEEDAIAEGIEFNPRLDPVGPCKWRIYGVESTGTSSPESSFQSLWESLHGKESWGSNPEVVAISFTVHEGNIDNMEPIARAR